MCVRFYQFFAPSSVAHMFLSCVDINTASLVQHLMPNDSHGDEINIENSLLVVRLSCSTHSHIHMNYRRR